MSNPVTFHELNMSMIWKENYQKDKTTAQMRDEYFEENHQFIERQTRLDLSAYVNNANTGYMRLPPLDKFVYSFLKKLSNVYDRPPVIQLKNDQGELSPPDDEDLKKINDLLKELNFQTFAKDSHMRAKLHNTILRQVRYNKSLDLMYLQNGYNVGTSIVKPLEDYSLEPLFVAYPYIKKDNKYQYVVWKRPINGSAGELYYTNSLKWDPVAYDFIGRKLKINPKQSINFNDYWPWIVQRERNQNELFWGHGFDAIIELVRFCYILLAVAGDDSIQETIRILILNFDPAGNKTEKGDIKVGLKSPIWRESSIPGDNKDAKGQILSAELHTKDILEFCYALADILGSMVDLPSVMKQKLTKALSGIHQRLINEPKLNAWSEDIGIVRRPDLETIETAIKVHNIERAVRNVGDTAEKTGKEISEKVLGNIIVDYSEPKILTDPKEDLEVAVKEWEMGVSNPVLYVREKNPDISSDAEAETYITNNQDITKRLIKLNQEKPGGFNFNRNTPSK